MEFRNHPLIAGLRINEDGTEIYYQGVLLKPFVNDKNRKNPTLKVNFINKAHSVSKLVCEAWNGLRANTGLRVSKINDLADNHYSNLEWKEGSSNGVGVFKQKLKLEDTEEITELIKSNKPIKEIASAYGVHDATIYRIKRKYDQNKEDQ
ncbi:hypothetical protein SAMN06265349_101698 [Flavobacterium resistens]|uniref:Insertion element IS150 protein InsJ-like helix-turn-helix domain-containing protein n=1 Tax=Flavobacterium resistens TaxID=443612 RepID=A0A521B5D4_9FLAO|nr:helix-turn-helix domain-containing protein [Flavobacterium resistens]MRX70298.1 hypothetical protein [Flavobacterium resistens]SMO42285.1 hypothetical protein SAMN06265349_101698 [Flavobacterium resistens]